MWKSEAISFSMSLVPSRKKNSIHMVTLRDLSKGVIYRGVNLIKRT